MVDRLTPEEVGRLPLFTGLASEELKELAEMSEVVTVSAGNTLFVEGDPPGDIYVMLEGRITLSLRVPGRPETSFLSLHAGELIGWSSLLARPRVATARVVQSSRVLRLRGSDVLELCETNHDVGYAIMRQVFEEMADRLSTTRMQLLDMFGKTGS
jgi:CRP-like cAMP-binding protein